MNAKAQTFSEEVSGTSIRTANLKVKAGSSQVNVSWDNTIANATNYKVYYSTNSLDSLSTATLGCDGHLENSCVIRGLTSGQVYYFTLFVSRTLGGNFQSSEEKAIPLSDFSIISITPSDNSATVTWSSSSGASSYDITYGISSKFFKKTFMITAGSGTIQKSIISFLKPSTQYFFNIKAKNAYGLVTADFEVSTMTLPIKLSHKDALSLISANFLIYAHLLNNQSK